MKNLPQISDAEFEVMDIIWKYAPISTNEITDRLAKTKDWSPKTIYTMLSRLEKKGVIVHEKESRVFVYTPCVKKDDYLAAESRTLADRFFDGAMKQMVVPDSASQVPARGLSFSNGTPDASVSWIRRI